MSPYTGARPALLPFALAVVGACRRSEPAPETHEDAAVALPLNDASVSEKPVEPDAAPAAPEPRTYKLVLHIGDSTVGGYLALTGAL